MTIRQTGSRCDDVARTAVLDDQLPFVGDDIVEANAALADDATLLVEHDRRTQIDGLWLGELRIGDVGSAARIGHRVILKVALAALIANRTIQRMVYEKELEYHRTSSVDLLAARPDGHAVRRRGVAGDLQLRRTFDLDDADAAEPRRSQLRVIAVNRDLLLDRLGGFDEQRSLRHRDRNPVDGEIDHLRAGGK